MQNEKEKRSRGGGSIFQNGSRVWWIKFSDRGIPRRESSSSTDRSVAEKLLKRRLAEVETKIYIPKANVKSDELVAAVLADYKDNALKTSDDVATRWKLHLAPFFSRLKATDIDTDRIRRYINHRRDQGASAATINRELAILKRAFHLALESTPPKITVVPHFPMQKENNVRTGFLRDEDHAKLANECGKEGLWLRTLLCLAYSFAFRKGELLAMRVCQIDLGNRIIRLEVGTTKNGKGRTISMTQEVFTLLSACIVGKKPDDYVFTRPNSKPVRDFRKTWNSVCVRAGVGHFLCADCHTVVTGENCDCGNEKLKYEGLIFHDLRRTGVRNLRRLGVAESVAMKISGHKTAAVFKRYDITDEADIADVAIRLDKKSDALSFGQSLGRKLQNSTTDSAAGSLATTVAILPN